jgi:F0F1-type ATP synthase assembly protein I
MTPNGGTRFPYLHLLTVGTVLVACIVVGYFLGRWADRGLGSHPWGVILGVVLGAAAGFVNLVRSVRTLK